MVSVPAPAHALISGRTFPLQGRYRLKTRRKRLLCNFFMTHDISIMMPALD
jgi:hypothetical protein